MEQAYLESALVESLDGDGDAAVPLAVPVPVSGVVRADEPLVDAAEPALPELLRAAEVVGGASELLVVEGPELAVAPLLVERGDAGLRGRCRPRGLARRPPRRPRGVVRPARAHRRSRGHGRRCCRRWA
jgi:hypothetical protein